MYDPERFSYGEEGGFGQALLGQAMGYGGPSAAEQQLYQGLDSSQRQAQSMAAGMRGLSPAMQLRRGQQAQTALAGQAQQQAAVLRAQEQERARQAWLQMQGMQGQEVMGVNQMQSQQSMLQAQMDAQLRNQIIGAGFGAAGAAGGMMM